MCADLETGRVATSAGLIHLACAGEVGNDPPAVLLHGIGSSADSFRRQLSGLSDEHRVIAWDAPGYARSEDLAGELTLEGYARAVVDVLDAVEAERMHLCGVSWGGLVATRVAIEYPDRVATLALIGSTPGRRGTDAIQNLEERYRLLEEVGPAGFAARRAARVLAAGADPDLAREVERNMSASIRLDGYRSAGATLTATRHEEELASVTAPTLVLVGDQDAVTGLSESRPLADGIPSAELVVVKGGGHLVNQELPEIVNPALHEHWTKEGVTS